MRLFIPGCDSMLIKVVLLLTHPGGMLGHNALSGLCKAIGVPQPLGLLPSGAKRHVLPLAQPQKAHYPNCPYIILVDINRG